MIQIFPSLREKFSISFKDKLNINLLKSLVNEYADKHAYKYSGIVGRRVLGEFKAAVC